MKDGAETSVRSPIETKVALPALVTGVLYVVGGATYAVALSFNWVNPTAEQTGALAGLGAALIWAVDRIVGYYAPHTPRDVLADASERIGAREITPEPGEEPTSSPLLARTAPSSR